MWNLWRVLLNVLRRSRERTPRDARVFTRTTEGSGIFGEWTLDAYGLPAYRYTLDQWDDKRARYPNTENLNRRDHWHQIGNDRITALVSNDGIIQLVIGDRGGVFLNRFEARDREGQSDPTTPPLPFGQRLLDIAAQVLLLFERIWRRLQLYWHLLISSTIHRQHPDPVVPRGTSSQPGSAQPQVTGKLAVVIPHTYSGGFGYVDDGTQAWATAYRYRPADAEVTRTFGIGRCDSTTTHRNIRVTRQVYAPPGDDAVLLNDVRIENLGSGVAHLRYYEYWDVNIHRLKLQWLRSGPFAVPGDESRRALNDDYCATIGLDTQMKVLRYRQQPRNPADHDPIDIGDVDMLPFDVFLANLSVNPIATCYTKKVAFFGQGGAVQPDAVRTRGATVDAAPLPDDAMPYCLVMCHDVELQPGAFVDLRYAYGAARPGDDLAYLDRYAADTLAPTIAVWRNRLAYFSAPGEDTLQREMAWHAHALLSAILRNDYYGVHAIPQGSAYLYLHGADGAPRDQALFTLPLTYLRPDMAREMLRMLMSMMHASNGQLPYAFTGFGYHSNALGLHAAPSDLDLFLLLALNEYLAATGDWTFLDSVLSYYPRGQKPAPPYGDRVFDHVRLTIRHLIDIVGIGQHGLIRIGDGDWSDSIVLETALKDPTLEISLDNTRRGGESIPNSQMALYVLPRIAAMLEGRDAALAAELRAFTAGVEKAVVLQWNGRWFTRAILRDLNDRPVPIADGWINLEAQPWALISSVAGRMDKEGVQARLIDSIRKLLDDPSPIGAPITERGMVWPAISQLLTWGYAQSQPELAWRSLKHNTFAAHAQVFPNIWYGLWSAPDGVYAADAPNAGYAWNSAVTPMTDFPVMNANPDAMALLGLLRVCGIGPAPTGDGLVIAPQSPPERFILDLPLIKLDVSPGRISGEYRAATTGNIVLHVLIPPAVRLIAASVRGQPLASAPGREVNLPLHYGAGETIPFTVTWE